MIRFSEAIAERNLELKRFLREHLYQHHLVYRMTTKSQTVITRLFDAFLDKPRLLPPEFFAQATAAEAGHGDAGRARIVADYVAGMTDRFAMDEYERLFDPRRIR